MKKIYIFIGLLCLCLYGRGQTGPKPIAGHIDTVYSQVLNEKRPVWVYSPTQDTTYFTRPEYPVLYVLDGDGYFSSFVTMLHELSELNGNTVLPQMIIVGIPNLPGKRTRDLTPVPNEADPASGGGELFTNFMQTELIPYIDAHYMTAPYRVLVGHSLGGLMAINTLLKRPEMFNSYVALDPSMSYDQANLLEQTLDPLEHKDLAGRSLFLGIGNTMPAGMDTAQVRADTSPYTCHIRSILMFKDALQLNSKNNLNWTYKYYPDDDHASMPLISEYDALRFLFRNNRFPRNQPQNQYFDPAFSAEDLRKAIEKHYDQVSKEYNYMVRPPEPQINQFAYMYLQLKNFEKAKMFFEVNIHYYPQSFNAYDGLGDYYLAIDDKPKAAEQFKRSLALKDRADIREKLNKLTYGK